MNIRAGEAVEGERKKERERRAALMFVTRSCAKLLLYGETPLSHNILCIPAQPAVNQPNCHNTGRYSNVQTRRYVSPCLGYSDPRFTLHRVQWMSRASNLCPCIISTLNRLTCIFRCRLNNWICRRPIAGNVSFAMRFLHFARDVLLLLHAWRVHGDFYYVINLIMSR